MSETEPIVADTTEESHTTTAFLTGEELVEYGDTDQVFENPESRRVEDYITGKFG